MITITLALLAAATNACASVLQRIANVAEVAANRGGLISLLDLLRRPTWVAGLGFVILSFLLQAAALAKGELAEVQPLMSLELPITLLLGSAVFGRSLGARDWVDIAVMTLGMAVFLFALAPTGGDPAGPSGWEWGFAAGGTGAVVAVLVAAAVLSRGNRRAAFFGTGAGVSFALTALFMAGALADGGTEGLLSRWQTYLVVLAGLTAMVLLQVGLQAGTLVAVQPGLTLSDPVVAVVLGVVLFGEEVRTGNWIFVEVLSALAVGWGAVQLIRSPVAAADAGIVGRSDEQQAALTRRIQAGPAGQP
jgi:drug/metabolite transporter (DMT)-like permease